MDASHAEAASSSPVRATTGISHIESKPHHANLTSSMSPMSPMSPIRAPQHTATDNASTTQRPWQAPQAMFKVDRLTSAVNAALRLDPALQKYYELNKNRWRYFRWTPRTAFISFMYAGFVPVVMGYVFWKYDGKWDLRGKLRGDPISEW